MRELDFQVKVLEALKKGEAVAKGQEKTNFEHVKAELIENFGVQAKVEEQLEILKKQKKEELASGKGQKKDTNEKSPPVAQTPTPTRANPAKLDAVGLSSVLESRTQSKRSTDEDVGLRGNITAVQEELLKQDIERRIAQSSQMQQKMAALERTNTGPQLRRSPEQVNLFENEAVNPTSSEETKAASTPVLSKGKSKEGEVARDVNKEYAKALNELGQAYKDKDETVLNDKKIDSHLKEIAKLIKLGADINSVDANRENIFHHIARIGTSSQFLQEAYPAIFQAEQVVRGKSEFNRKNAEGKTILDVAYENNNYGTMVTLISAAPKDQRKELLSSLKLEQKEAIVMHIAENGSREKSHPINFFSEELKNPELKNRVLEAAIERNDNKVLAAVVNDLTPDEYKEHASAIIRYAIDENQMTLLDKIPGFIDATKNKGLINTLDKEGKASIHYAAENAAIKTGRTNMDLLIQKGADVNLPDKDGMTPLSYVAKSGNNEALEILGAHGANFKAKSKDGSNIFHYLSIPDGQPVPKGITKRMSFLANITGKSLKSMINEENEAGVSPLHQAAIDKKSEVYARFLIDNGADIKAKDKSGKTAFDHALENNSIGTLKVLLGKMNEKELDHYISDPKTASQLLLVAATIPDKALFEKCLSNPLVEPNYNIRGSGTPLSNAVNANQLQMVEDLLQRGVNPNQLVNKQTPLVKAAADCQIPIMKVLLENGARADAQKSEAIHGLAGGIASGTDEAKRIEGIKMLLQYGANPDAKNKHGLTPLHQFVNQGNEEGIKLLLAYGADVNIKNEQGKSPLDMAQEKKINLAKLQEDAKSIEKKELKPKATDISREEKGKEKEQMQQKGVKFDEQLQTSREAELKKGAVRLKSALKKTEHHWAQEVKANSSSTTSRER